MIRRVIEQGFHTVDNERLVIITVFETGVNKEQVKADNEYAKRHLVLVSNDDQFEFKGELG